MVAEAQKRLIARQISAKGFLQACQDAEELQPDDEIVNNALGDAFERLGQLVDAVKHYEAAHKAAPAWKLPIYGMADVKLEQKGFDEAARLYEQGLNLPAAVGDVEQDEDARRKLIEAQRLAAGYVSEGEILNWRHGNAAPHDRGIRVVPAGPAASVGGVVGAPGSAETRLMLNIYFDLDKSALSPLMREQADALGRAMSSDGWGNKSIRLIGHACPLGSLDYNERLSEKRAKAVRDYLVFRWRLAPEQILVEWVGARDPVRNPDGSVDYERSRRTELAPAP